MYIMLAYILLIFTGVAGFFLGASHTNTIKEQEQETLVDILEKSRIACNLKQTELNAARLQFECTMDETFTTHANQHIIAAEHHNILWECINLLTWGIAGLYIVALCLLYAIAKKR